MKTKTEIINETVEYYTNNPRAKSVDGFCKYLTKEGNRCAFSRCCTEEGVKVLHHELEGDSCNQFAVDNYLKEEYQGHDLMFWRNIQRLHDNDDFWKNGKLTLEGEKYVQDLINLYK